MKKVLFALFALFASSAFSQPIIPIMSFPPGSYLGQGSWLADDASFGSYSALILLRSNGWNTAILLYNSVYLYEDVLSIDPNGFFTVQLTDASDPYNPVVYNGYGNCGSSQCQLTAALNGGVLQKSIIFDSANNSISTFGAIYYDNAPSVQWEDTSVLMPTMAQE